MSSVMLPGAMSFGAGLAAMGRVPAPQAHPFRLNGLGLPVSFTRPATVASRQSSVMLSLTGVTVGAGKATASLPAQVKMVLGDAVSMRRPAATAALPDGSRLTGQITLNKDNSVHRVEAGTTRTVGASPAKIDGKTWQSGTFESDGQNWNLKGSGTELTASLKGYDTKGQTVEHKQAGDGSGLTISRGFGDAKGGDGKISDLSTGLTADRGRANSWQFSPGQTGKLNIQGQTLNLNINQEGKLSSPLTLTVPQGGTERTFQVQGVAPNLGTGGVQMITQVNLKPQETLKVNGLSGREAGSVVAPDDAMRQQRTAVPGGSIPAANIKIRQDGNSYVLSGGQTAVALVTKPEGTPDGSGPARQSVIHLGAILPEGSKLTVTEKTELPNGLTVHTGQVEVTDWGNKMEPKSGTIYQTPGEDTPRLYHERLQADAFVEDLDIGQGTFKAVMDQNSGGLDTGERVNITRLEVPGTIDRETGEARLTDGTYRADAEMYFNGGQHEFLTGEYEGQLTVVVKNNEVYIKDLGQNGHPDKADCHWQKKAEFPVEAGLPFTALTETATAGLHSRNDVGSRIKEAVVAVLTAPMVALERVAKALWDTAGSILGTVKSWFSPAPEAAPQAETAGIDWKTLTPGTALAFDGALQIQGAGTLTSGELEFKGLEDGKAVLSFQGEATLTGPDGKTSQLVRGLFVKENQGLSFREMVVKKDGELYHVDQGGVMVSVAALGRQLEGFQGSAASLRADISALEADMAATSKVTNHLLGSLAIQTGQGSMIALENSPVPGRMKEVASILAEDSAGLGEALKNEDYGAVRALLPVLEARLDAVGEARDQLKEQTAALKDFNGKLVELHKDLVWMAPHVDMGRMAAPGTPSKKEINRNYEDFFKGQKNIFSADARHAFLAAAKLAETGAVDPTVARSWADTVVVANKKMLAATPSGVKDRVSFLTQRPTEDISTAIDKKVDAAFAPLMAFGERNPTAGEWIGNLGYWGSTGLSYLGKGAGVTLMLMFPISSAAGIGTAIGGKKALTAAGMNEDRAGFLAGVGGVVVGMKVGKMSGVQAFEARIVRWAGADQSVSAVWNQIKADVFDGAGGMFSGARSEAGYILLGKGPKEISGYPGIREASKFLRENGVPRRIRQRILQSFEPETVVVRKASANEFGTRYFDLSEAKPKGHYLFETFPASRDSLALPTEWNQMQGIRQWRIKPDTVIIEGRASAQQGWQGGQKQKYVLDLDRLVNP